MKNFHAHDDPADKTRPMAFEGLTRISVAQRPCKVAPEAVAATPEYSPAVGAFLDSLPDFLAVRSLRALAAAIAEARRAGLPVIFAIGGHVVKVGCSPILIDLMRRGVITHLAMNGSVAIHDYELATVGATSEDVGAALHQGLFGMVTETAQALAAATADGARKDKGLGAAMGDLILNSGGPNVGVSVLAAARRWAAGATVHVGIGCDTVHMHPECCGADIGAASHTDFRILCAAIRAMHCDTPEVGGVFVNCGSAVFMPEVFLKAFNVARNVGANLDGVTTANLDMIQHYRPRVNVVGRPAAAGRGLALTGHHEIMLPLLRMAILAALETPADAPGGAAD